MSDRKAELERKKAKLQAMREEKKRKDEERRRLAQAGGEVIATGATGDLRSETEQMLKDLGIPAGPGTGAGAAPPAAAQMAVSSGGSSEGDLTPVTVQASPQRKVQLGVSKITQTNIPPREMVAYSKETQTPVEQVDHDDDTDSLDVAVDTPPPIPHHTKMPHAEPVKPALTPDEVATPKEEDKKPLVRELTDVERQQILLSEDFQKFFDKSTRVMERALADNKDILADMLGEGEDDELGLNEGERLKLNRQFFDERWTKHRTVTCMDWSTTHPELLVASYNQNEESPNEPDGVCLIWNIKYKKSTPDYIFHCQSAVMSTCFAKFHPNLIIGGTYSGQIVLWDNRSCKRTPVQRTPLSAAAHTHPVYCVNVVGTQNAHNLISVSTDGKMCSWSLDMLSQPQDAMELQHKQTKSVAVTSYSFLSGDVNNFVVGSEEGCVYTACRHGSKAGISDMFEGHQGPITGIDCHTVPGQIDFSQYFLTSSFDWTVKLWNIRENRPLHSFEDNSDYVYDARWSPVHPALFAAVDGMGRLDLWNLNNDTEVPTASTIVDSNTALNRCRWHQNGQQIAVGDDNGRIHIYDVADNIAQPRNDDWQKFVHSLQELKNQQAEQDEDPTLSSVSSSPIR